MPRAVYETDGPEKLGLALAIGTYFAGGIVGWWLAGGTFVK